MSSTSIPTPRLCRKSPDASPLATSGYCLASPIAAVALTRLPKTAVLAAGETRPRQRAAAVAGHDYLAQGRRRWGLLAAVALGAWQSATGQALTAPITKPETVVIRGLVLDDSLNVPVPGLFLYLNDTKYGAITDERGEFTFNYPAAWKPVRGGVLKIQAIPVPYTFKPMRVQLDWRSYDPMHPLTLRLASAPGRGRPNLHGYIGSAPPVPPPVYPARSHTARP